MKKKEILRQLDKTINRIKTGISINQITVALTDLRCLIAYEKNPKPKEPTIKISELREWIIANSFDLSYIYKDSDKVLFALRQDNLLNFLIEKEKGK